MHKVIKVVSNSMLLLLLVGVIALPAVSSGLLHVNSNIKVLSSQDWRPDNTAKREAPSSGTKKVETVIIREIPVKKVVIPDGHVITSGTSAVAKPYLSE